jgi:hypothetical protein
MSYSGTCLCGNAKCEFEFDPMMHFQCHCNTCQGVFGTSLSALAMPKHELNIEGELTNHTISGGSGMDMHYYFCASCGVIIYNEPELLGGMIYIPAGVLYDQIEFNPTVELWSGNRPKWMSKAKTIIESFQDNGTVERITELLENLDQRG